MTAALRVSTIAMPHEQWLELRKTGIGGSDAASVLGLNPYKSNFALFEEKVGLRDPDDLSDNEAVYWGNVLEEPVAQAFAERTGRKVRRVNAIVRHPDYPFMLGNIDREIVAEEGGKPEILECKTAGIWAANAEEWGPSGSDWVPERYLIQCMHYLAVCNRDVAHLAALIGGQELRLYKVARDEKLIAALIAKEAAFWKLVESQVAPTILELADARRAFPISTAKIIDATSEIFGEERELREVERELKRLEARKENLQGKICGFMGDAGVLMRGPRRLRTWLTQERNAINQGKLKTEQPDIFARYCETTTSRVFRACKDKDEE
jgi:putative phage-type endonuclease